MFYRMSLLATTVAACCISAQATAAEQLEEVVVTASRTEQPISEVIGSVTVITREEIEKRQAQSLQELLRGELGIDITNQGGQGKISNIFMRGANSNQTIILLDGQRLDSATDGATRIELIPVDQIQRIEIVRGPRSSLYGSDAIGGVIQIFTRDNQGVSASISTGTYNTHNVSAGYGTERNGLRIKLNGNHQQSDGFNARSDGFEADNDGYKNRSLNGQIGYSFGNIADIELKTLYATGYTEFDDEFGFYKNLETKFTNSTPNLKISIHANDLVSITATNGIAINKTETFSNNTSQYRFDTTKQSSSLQLDIHSKAIKFSLGLDHTKDSLDSTSSYTKTETSNTGIFEQLSAIINNQELSQSVRRDNKEQIGSHDTYNLGYKWFSSERKKSINLGVGQAFHAPTFNDLYFPQLDYYDDPATPYSEEYHYKPNPNLKPETSRSFEVGTSGYYSGGFWSLQRYYTEVKDLIDGNHYDAATAIYSPQNISTARIEGTEISVTKSYEQITTMLNYTIQDPRSLEEGANYNHTLARRSRQSGRLTMSYDLGSAKLSTNVNAIGPRFDDIQNTKRMGGYTTIDLLAAVPFKSGFSLQLKAANVLDRHYETVSNYNQEGRNISLQLSYHPENKYIYD